MLPKRTRHLLYALLVVGLSVISASAVEVTPLTDLLDRAETSVLPVVPESKVVSSESPALPSASLGMAETPYPFFTKIILNADEEVSCSDNGFTIARFNLCGDFDDRVIGVSGSHGTYEWQQLVPRGSCTFDVNEDCPPIIGNQCNASWETIGSASSLTLSAAAIPAATGGEIRVCLDGGTDYYFKVKKSTITQTYVKRDFICGVPGRIQIRIIIGKTH